MLDLSVLIQKLTQGRPPAVMALAAPPEGAAGEGAPGPLGVGPAAEPQTGGAAETGPAGLGAQTAAPAEVDVSKLADKVYDLLRREVQVERTRRGNR